MLKEAFRIIDRGRETVRHSTDLRDSCPLDICPSGAGRLAADRGESSCEVGDGWFRCGLRVYGKVSDNSVPISMRRINECGDLSSLDQKNLG
jgi:hypothetical protein